MSKPAASPLLPRWLSEQDPFEAIRTDPQLALLVTTTARDTDRPFTELLSRLVGTTGRITEADARALWTAIVEHRRQLTSQLDRGVHLRVAALDYLSQHGGLRPLVISRATLRKLLSAATIDPLTGLLNRAQFEALLTHELEQRRARRVVVVWLDLDGFKRVNDTRGHAAGDAVLEEVAQVLRAQARGGDQAGRVGGDEFAILLVDADEAQASKVLRRIQAEIHRRFAALGIGISGGIAASVNGDHPASLLARADAAMYLQKAARTKGVGRAPVRVRAGERTVLYGTRNADRLRAVSARAAPLGWTVVPAPSLEHFVSLSALVSPGLLLADLLFPPRGGQEALQATRTSGLRIVSALVAPRRFWSMQGQRAGMPPVLPWPAEPAEIDALLQRAGSGGEPLPVLATDQEARLLMKYVSSLVTGRRAPEAAWDVVRERPEVDWLQRMLGA